MLTPNNPPRGWRLEKKGKTSLEKRAFASKSERLPQKSPVCHKKRVFASKP
jgi:hypothetical protein